LRRTLAGLPFPGSEVLFRSILSQCHFSWVRHRSPLVILRCTLIMIF
jgi:hypothetical protein